MANSDKNILITPNKNSSSQPEIAFTGAGNSTFSSRASDTSGLNFVVGSATTAFSIDHDLGSPTSLSNKKILYSVSDQTSSPLFAAQENGDVYLKPNNGAVKVSNSIRLPEFFSNNFPNGTEGQLIYDKTNKVVRVFDGVNWKQSTGSVTDVDLYWKNVALLVKDGETIDHTGRHQIYTSGSATRIDSVPPFKNNGLSWSLGQSTSSYIEYRNRFEDFALGSNTVWTLEMWIYHTNTSSYAHYFVPGGQTNQGTFKSWWNNSSDWRPYMYTANGNMVGANNSQAISNFTHKWTWLVFQRDGSNMRIWIDGTSYETSNSGGSIPKSVPGGSQYSSSTVVSGAWSNESVPFYLDELRLTLGVARYGTASTIPLQTKTWPTMGP